MSHQTTTQSAIQTDRWAGLRERFLCAPLPIRLGELSSSLAGVRQIADQTTPEKIAIFSLKEPELYLEWGFPDADAALDMELTQMRELIAQVKKNWQTLWENPAERSAIGASFAEWSRKMLDRSGLLNYGDWREVFRAAPPVAEIKTAAQATQ